MIWILFMVINNQVLAWEYFPKDSYNCYNLIPFRPTLSCYRISVCIKWICKECLVQWEVSCGRWILVWQHLGGFLTRCVWNFAKAMILWWRRALFQSDELSVTLERRGSNVQWVPLSHCTQSTVHKKYTRCFELIRRIVHCTHCPARALPKGLRAKSARAVTGRRNSHRWEGGPLFEPSAGFFYRNSCNFGTKSRKIVSKVGN